MIFEKSALISEMVGIILGDGRLRWEPENRHYQLDIILNWVDEKDYVEYVTDLMRLVFNKEPSIYRQIKEDGIKGKGIYLTIYGKQIVKGLISIGLRSGNKVVNQVNIPEWIKNYNPFVVACLRGLVDTDGSIFPVIKENAIKINFKNGSYPLVVDFKNMTNSLQIRTSKISSYEEISEKTGKISKVYIVQIQARKEVKEFIEKIKPMKWKFRREKLLSIVNEPFEYRMNFYSEDEIIYWKNLYEQLKSFEAVRDFLRRQGLKPFRIDTIRSRIKSLLGDKYNQWLREIKNI